MRVSGSLVAVALALAGCGGSPDVREDRDGAIPSRSDASGEDGSPGPDAGTETATVGPEGGTVLLAGGDVRLEIPPGAVSAPIELSATPVHDLPSDRQLVEGTAWDLGPDGTRFAVPVRLTVRYRPELLSDTRTSRTFLRIHRLTDGLWVESPGGETDTAAATASAMLSGFSLYALRFSFTVMEETMHGGWRVNESPSGFRALARPLDCTGYVCRPDGTFYEAVQAECGGDPFTSGSYFYFDPEGWGVWDQGPHTAAWIDSSGAMAVCMESTFWYRSHFVWIIENGFSADDFWVTMQGEQSVECSGGCDIPFGAGVFKQGLGTGSIMSMHLHRNAGPDPDFLAEETGGASPGSAPAIATRCSPTTGPGAIPCGSLSSPFNDSIRRYR